MDMCANHLVRGCWMQRLLLEVQSAVALCPTAVPQLLEALHPEQMQHLATSLAQLHQQAKHEQLHPHRQHGGVTTAAAAADALVQRLQHLGVVDVLLLISLTAQQQWAADVSLVLMHGVLEAGRYGSCAVLCWLVHQDTLLALQQPCFNEQSSASLLPQHQ